MASTAALMSGTELAKDIVARCTERSHTFEVRTGRRPCLVTVLVGDDPASVTYVKMKQNRRRTAGIEFRRVHLPDTATTKAVIAAVSELSHESGVDGILLQHPVPAHVDERAAFEAIAPSKDVDGVTMHSFAAIAFGHPGFASCTPAGIMKLLDAYDVAVEGAHAVVIGRSPILGKPAGMMLLARNATVTYCHSRTRNLPSIVGSADIVVAAVGRANFVRGDWIKPRAVVVDAGYNEGNVGDIAFDEALLRASLVTPGTRRRRPDDDRRTTRANSQRRLLPRLDLP